MTRPPRTEGTTESRTISGVHIALLGFGVLLFGVGIALSVGFLGFGDELSGITDVQETDDADGPADETNATDGGDEGIAANEDGEGSGTDTADTSDEGAGNESSSSGVEQESESTDEQNRQDESDDGEGTETTLEIEATGAGSVTYDITVSGRIEPVDAGTSNRSDVDGDRASGEFDDGSRVFEFTGDVTNLVVDGDANVYIDGEFVYSTDDER